MIFFFYNLITQVEKIAAACVCTCLKSPAGCKQVGIWLFGSKVCLDSKFYIACIDETAVLPV